MIGVELTKLSTSRLLGRLKDLRARVSQYWLYFGDDDAGRREYARAKDDVEKIKAILATREHYPRGKKGRQLRQQAKQNR